jgi:hypothetical protein
LEISRVNQLQAADLPPWVGVLFLGIRISFPKKETFPDLYSGALYGRLDPRDY